MAAIFQESFKRGLDSAYRLSGDTKLVNKRLQLGPRAALYRDLAAGQITSLRVYLAEADLTRADWKFQISLYLSENRRIASAQVIRSGPETKAILFGTSGGEADRDSFREFPLSRSPIGRWELSLAHGHLVLKLGDEIVGETFINATTPVEGIMLASVRGTTAASEITVLSKPSPIVADTDRDAFEEANAASDAAEMHALYARHTDAIKDITSALAVYQRLFGEGGFRTAWAHSALGSYLRRAGAYRLARTHAEQAFNAFNNLLGPQHPFTASSQQLLANILSSIGDDDQAFPLAQSALTTVLRVYEPESPTTAASLSTYAGIAANLGRRAEAENALKMALGIREQYFGKEDVHLAPYLIQLAELYLRSGKPDLARDLFSKALTIVVGQYGENHPDAARIRRSVGESYLLQGNLQAAITHYKNALAGAERSFGAEHPNIALILHGLALTYFAALDYGQARALAERALQIQIKVAEDVAIGSSSAEALGFVSTVYRVRDLILSVGLADPAISAIDLYRNLAYGRGLYTRVQLANIGKFDHRRLSDASKSKLAELNDIRSFVSAFTLYRGNMADDSRIPMLIDVITKEKERLERELIAEANRDKRGAFGPLARLEESLARLPVDVAVVDILRANRWLPIDTTTRRLPRSVEYHAVVMRRDQTGALSIARVALGDAQRIEQNVQRWLRAISQAPATDAPDPAAVDAALWFREHVWVPILKTVDGAKTIVVVPDGIFSLVPWAATMSDQPDRYVVEDGYSVVSALSLDHVLRILNEPQTEFGANSLLIGDVGYGPRQAQASAADIPAQSDGGPIYWLPLKGAAAELNAVAALIQPGQSLVELRGLDATERGVEQAMTSARHIHIATHGFYVPSELDDALIPNKDPTFKKDWFGLVQSVNERSSRSSLIRNGIVLSGANGITLFEQGTIRLKDGILTAEELAGIALERTELVVLSSCESALGLQRLSEGTFGLQRTFLLAGAGSVLAGLWRVDDRATMELMKKFYEALWRGKLTKLDGLRAAQLHMLNLYDARSGTVRGPGSLAPATERAVKEAQPAREALHKAPPYFWAGFSLGGEWR